MAHILIVDDELSIRETFQAFLEEDGYDVTTAADFFEAESFLARLPSEAGGVDVVVVDIIMPHTNGLALLQRVREIDEDIPVITITGEPDVSTAAEAVRRGAYDYVAKPVTQRVLNRVVGRAAEKKRLLDEQRRLEAENRAYQAGLEQRVAERTAELEQRNQEMAALFEKERGSRRLADTLREIAQALNSTLSLNDVLGLILAELEKVIAFDSSSIMLLEDKALVVYAVKGFTDPDSMLDVRLNLDTAPLNYEVVESKQPLIIGSVHEDERWLKSIEIYGLVPELHDIRSWMGIPLLVKGRVIGMLTTDKVEAHFYDEQDAEIASIFANQAASAIENARLFEETQQQARDLGLLCNTGRLLASSLEATKVLNQIARRCTEVFDADLTLVRLIEDDWLVVRGSYYRDLTEREKVEGLLTAHPIHVGEAIAGQVATSGQPAVHRGEDVSHLTLPGYVDYLRTREWVLVPMQIGETITGVLTVIRRSEKGPFLERDVTLAQGIADQAVIAIENARLFEETQKHVARLERTTRDLELVHQVSQVVSSSLDMTSILEVTVEQMVAVFEADHSGILLFDQAQTHGQVVAEYPPTGATAEWFPVQGYLAAERIIADREPLVIKDTWSDPLMATVQEAMRRLDIRSMLITPLIVKGKVVGSIGLDAVGRQRRFNAEEVALAQTIANQVSIVIENARLFEETKRRADEMMALYHTSLEIGASTGLPDLLWTICDRAAGLLDVDKGGLYLYDEAREELELVVSYKLGQDFVGTRLKLGEGVAGRMVQTGQSLTVDDYSCWEGRAPVYEEEPFAAVIGVLLRWQERTIGAITLSEETKRRTFTPDDERLLGLFAQQAAVAIESARLYEEARRRVEELVVLHNIDVAITSTLKLDKVLQRIYEQVSTVMNITTFHIALYDEEKDELYIPIIVDQGKQLPPQTIRVENGLSGWVVRTQESLWIEDMEKERDTLPVKAVALGAPTRSLMVLPLIARDKVVGVMSAQSHEPHAFDAGHRRLFSGIASQVAIAIENARLFEETNHRLAETRLLQEIMQDAASTLDFDQVLERTIEALHRTLGIEYLNFALPDEGGTVLVTHPSMIGFSPSEGYFCLPLDESVMGQVYQTEEPVLIPDVRKVPYYFEGTSKVRSELAVPVKVAGRVIAVLNAESPLLAAFDEDDLRLFTAIAAQLGVVLENTRLYQTLQERTEELSQAYEELRELDHLRTELVQNVGHELRTPLTLIMGYVELLLAGDLGEIHNDQRAALQIVRKRTDTLAHLIHNLTMLQTMPREALVLVPVSAVAVVRHAMTGFQHFAEEAGITFREELPSELPPVPGDQEQLELAFSHLVDNAVKFSPDGGTITLRAWADKARVYVSITDEGIGITLDHLDNIFERFYQVDGTPRRRFGGMGIGLAVVWEIVKAHGGTVSVESEPGKGSTFTVALSRARTRISGH